MSWIIISILTLLFICPRVRAERGKGERCSEDGLTHLGSKVKRSPGGGGAGCSLANRSSRWLSPRWSHTIRPMGKKRRWTQVRTPPPLVLSFKCDEAAVLRSADRFGGKDREKMHTRNLSVSFWKDNFWCWLNSLLLFCRFACLKFVFRLC